MKRPAIEEIDRKIMRELPETFTAQRLNLYLACAKLKREIIRQSHKLIKK